MRILAMRMNEAVVQFVSKCQTGFVPDSFLPENTMLLNMIQQHLENEDDADNYLVFLDMEKAFDRCSWDFLIDRARPECEHGAGAATSSRRTLQHEQVA